MRLARILHMQKACQLAVGVVEWHDNVYALCAAIPVLTYAHHTYADIKERLNLTTSPANYAKILFSAVQSREE